MIELIRHITKSGNPSPFWIVVDGLERFKVASFACAKLLIKKLEQSYYGSGTQRPTRSEHCRENGNSEVRNQENISVSSEFRVNSLSFVVNEVHTNLERIDIGVGDVLLQDIVSTTNCGTGISELVGGERTIVGIEQSSSLYVESSVGGDQTSQENSNEGIQEMLDAILERFDNTQKRYRESHERERESHERERESHERYRTGIENAITEFVVGIGGIDSIYETEFHPRVLEGLPTQDERDITKNVIFY